MNFLHHTIDFILHMNVHLASLVNAVGDWSYLILFAVIFAETGLVVAPFLPGDSLLFATGALASITILNIHIVVILLILAAIVGNSTNYAIGYWLGPKVFHYPKSRCFNPNYLHKAHKFYEKYGGQAIIIARFIPIVRTFAPFVAGIARMNPIKFQIFNCTGSILWVTLISYLGYFFGNVPVIQQNFGYMIIAIIVISIIPPVIELLRQRWSKH